MASGLRRAYACVATLLSPALRGYLRYRALRGKEIASRLPERRGIDRFTRPEGRLIWLHAASVGETQSILPILSSLATRDPNVLLLVTTGTVTSAQLLNRRLPELGLAHQVTHRFIPLDVPIWVARFLDHWRPSVAGFVESELWPNILAACQARAIPAMLINARMSKTSFAAWSRVPWAAQAVLSAFAHIQARGEEDAERLRALGAGHVESPGDLKMAAAALPADEALLADMAARVAGAPVFLAASTHPGEEPLIQQVHVALASAFPGLLTIIVPRHPERGAALAEALRATNRAHPDHGYPPEGGGVWIADTIGELGVWYRLSDVVFIGRSLIAPGGGQNPLEPARLGRAIATGPLTGNFVEHVARLHAANALEITPDAAALIQFAHAMLADPVARREMGARAIAAVAAPETLASETARTLLSFVPRP